MSYIKRLVEDDLIAKMAATGALLIKGPKSCGKTETATQYANSILRMDQNDQHPTTLTTQPVERSESGSQQLTANSQ